jgi:putative phosphoesterase
VALRIAVIADTHMPRGERRLPPSCLQEIEGSDLLLHAGDFASEEVFDQLARIGPALRAVHGNVDSPHLQSRLPEELSLKLEGVVVAMLHDAGPARGRLQRMRLRFPDADAVVFGHSHMPLHERSGGFQIFNPGSPTERRRAPAHTMGIAEVADSEIRFRHLNL